MAAAQHNVSKKFTTSDENAIVGKTLNQKGLANATFSKKENSTAQVGLKKRSALGDVSNVQTTVCYKSDLRRV